MAFLYGLSAHYTNGFLPESGGVLDQSYKLMVALAIVSSEKQACEEEKRAIDRAKEAKQARQVAIMQGRG
jgi:hypothetical protein